MRILCPHCNNPIELVKLTPHEEISCPSCGSSFHLDTGATTGWQRAAGQKVGRFELIDVVGTGAFGTVYKARDPELDRIVALKVPRAGNLAGPEERDRFLREARSAAQLRHPSIVSVHEVAQSDGIPCLVSDFAEGMTLTDLLSARRPGFREAAGIIADVADALHYAHSQGVVHRDVKPSNIMIGVDGKPCVMDFGLAKRDAGEITMTVEGQILGTPAYMPPEQARGEGHAVDGRGDVYSLGVILYQMLTGELPFRGTARALLHQVLHDEPRPPRSLNDHVARDLQTVCLKALAKEPGRRYQSASELADDLRRWLKGEPIKARPVGRFERGWRWVKRNPTVASLTAAVAVVLVAGASISTAFALQAGAEARRADERADEAARERDKAEGLQKEAKKEQKKAEEERKKTEAALAVTATQRALSLDTIRGVLQQVNNLMKNDEKLAPLRIQIINQMLKDLDKVRDHALKNPLADRTEALAYAHLGELYSRLNRVADAAVWQNKAQAIYAALAKESPKDVPTMLALSERSLRLAETEHRLGNGEKARRLFTEALRLRQEHVKLLQTGKGGRSDLDLASALSLANRGLADAYIGLAYFQLLERDFQRAIDNYTGADKALSSLTPLDRSMATIRMARLEIQVRVADAQWKLGRLDEAEKRFRAALADRESMLKTNRGLPRLVPILKDAVGASRLYLGDFLREGRRNLAGAHAEYGLALGVFSEILKTSPNNLQALERLGSTHYRLGMTAPDPKKAEEAYKESLKSREQLAKIDAWDILPKVQLAFSKARLGRAAEVIQFAEVTYEDVTDKGLLLGMVEALGVAADATKDLGMADRCRDLGFDILWVLARKGRLTPADLKSDDDLLWVEKDRRYKDLFTGKPPTPVTAPSLSEQGLFKKAQVGDFATFSFQTLLPRTAKIIARDDSSITVQWSRLIVGQENVVARARIDLTKPLDPAPLISAMIGGGARMSQVRKRQTGRETIKVGGREYHAIWEQLEVKSRTSQGGVALARVKVWWTDELSIPWLKVETTPGWWGNQSPFVMELTKAGHQKEAVKAKP